MITVWCSEPREVEVEMIMHVSSYGENYEVRQKIKTLFCNEPGAGDQAGSNE